MAATLTEEQKLKVTAWIGEGASLAEVQKRISSEFNITLTYMDTRFLLDDLNLVVKEAPKKAAVSDDLTKTAAAVPVADGKTPPAPGSPVSGRVAVTVDKIVRPGAVASGMVTFSDGQKADWYLDQSGRLGLIPKTQGYKPKEADVQEFQYTLQEELARLGY